MPDRPDTVAAVDADDLQQEALTAAAEAGSLAALDEVRVRYLGRRSALKLALRDVRDRETGMTLNSVRETVLEVGDGILAQRFQATPSRETCAMCDYRITCPVAEA